MKIQIEYNGKELSFARIIKKHKTISCLIVMLFCIGFGFNIYADYEDSLITFYPGNEIKAEEINHNFEYLQSLTDTTMPIGSIIAWHKNIASGLQLPENWVLCNGSVIRDSESPLNGYSAPNLNSTKKFLRGSTTSGINQDQSVQEHNHRMYACVLWDSDSDTRNHFPMAGKSEYWSDSQVADTGDGVDTIVYKGYTDNSTQGNETRPINMSVVWIMKIK